MENAGAEKNEVVVNLAKGEKITLTYGDLMKLIRIKIERGAKAKLQLSQGFLDSSLTTPLSDINDMFFYMTLDAMEGRMTSEKFLDLMNYLGLKLEEWSRDEKDGIILWEIAETQGFVFALSQMVIVKRGYGKGGMVINKDGVKNEMEYVDREDWAESFKKTLKKLEVK